MELAVYTQDETTTLSVCGEFDAASVQEMRPRFEELLETTSRSIVIDMSGCTFLDSSGIGTLVFLFKRLATSGRSLRLGGLAGQPRELITFLRIDRVIDIDDRRHRVTVLSNPQMVEAA